MSFITALALLASTVGCHEDPVVLLVGPGVKVDSTGAGSQAKVLAVTALTPTISTTTCGVPTPFSYSVDIQDGASTAVVFSSTNHAISVSSVGVVAFKSPPVAGDDTIRIKSVFDSTKSASVLYHVDLCNGGGGVSVASVTISPATSHTFIVGEQLQYTGAAQPANAPQGGTFSSSDSTKIKVVRTTGLATALAVGTAIIRFTSSSDTTKSSSVTDTVVAALPGISITPLSATGQVGTTLGLRATGVGNAGGVIWYSTDNTILLVTPVSGQFDTLATLTFRSVGSRQICAQLRTTVAQKYCGNYTGQ